MVVLQIDERDNRCEAKKLAKETLNAPIGFSKRTKLFSNPLGFFFPPLLQLELKVSKIEASFENWKRFENSIFDEMVLFFGKFSWKDDFWRNILRKFLF